MWEAALGRAPRGCPGSLQLGKTGREALLGGGWGSRGGRQQGRVQQGVLGQVVWTQAKVPQGQSQWGTGSLQPPPLEWPSSALLQ